MTVRSRQAPAWLAILPALILYGLTYIPALVVILAVSAHTYVQGEFASDPLTADNYLRFVTDAYYTGLAFSSLYLSAAGSLLSVLIAFPMAYAIVRSKRLRAILLPIIGLAFFVSVLVHLYGWLGILARGGTFNGILTGIGLIHTPLSILYTPVAVVIGLADFGLPYAALVLISSVNALDQSLEQASQNLGATRWQTFVRVTLPLTAPGLLAAFILTFALNISSVLTPVVLGGSRVPTVATQIYLSMINLLNYPFASASIVILLLVAFMSIGLVGRMLRTRTSIAQ